MIYLDNAATTEVVSPVFDVLKKYMCENYANISSMHSFGLDVERKYNNAVLAISRILGCEANNLIFTSGATESNNTIINSVYEKFKNKDKHFITTNIEHPSVLECFNSLEKAGAEVDYIKISNNFEIDINVLLQMIKPHTRLISIMHVNNEIGVVFPIKKIVDSLRASGYKGYIHTDATQSMCKISCDVMDLGVDYLSASAHKLHGPKGVGLIYAKNTHDLNPLIIGGAQQSAKRSGTVNSSGIVAMAKAMMLMDERRDEYYKEACILREMLYKYASEHQESCLLVGDVGENFSPYINSMVFFNIKSEILLHSLEKHGIMVASGSACSSKSSKLSHVLSAIDNGKMKNGAIRISFSHLNTRDDVMALFSALDVIVPELESVISSSLKR